MQLNHDTSTHEIQQMMGPAATVGEARSMLRMMINDGYTDTDQLMDGQWQAYCNAAFSNPEADIRITPIGTIEQGIDGRDEYVLITSMDDALDADFAHDWLLPQVYRESLRPGGYFCTSVTIMPHPLATNQCVAIIHHRYDV